MEPFLLALSDDMNVPNALTYLLEIIKEANVELRKKEKDQNLIKDIFYTLTDMSYILGLHYTPTKLSEEDNSLYKAYLKAKEDKDFALSDKYREELIKKNIL